MIARKAPKRSPATRIGVKAEERRRLIEDSAFFRAEQFRDVQPGVVRQQDLEAAAADVDAALGLRRRRRRKR